MSKDQLAEISRLLLAYSSGNYSVKGNISSSVNELDMIISGINMLGEEIETTNVSRDFFSSIFNSVTDLVFVININGKVRESNSASHNVFGHNRDELEILELRDIFKSGREDVFGSIRKGLTQKEQLVFEREFIDKNDRKRLGLFTCSKLYNRFEEMQGYLVVVKDITQQRRHEQMILQATITTQQKEQKRVASVLHDSLGQELSMAKLMVSNMSKYKKDNKDLAKLIEVSEEILDRSVGHLREICFDLMPGVLVKGGLEMAISDLVQRLNKQDKVKGYFECEEEFPRLKVDLEISVFRIVQEFISNMIKHSEATELDIKLHELGAKRFMLLMSENGQGFDKSVINERVGESRGYGNIRSNVNAFNGTFNLESSEKGTILTVTFPKNS